MTERLLPACLILLATSAMAVPAVAAPASGGCVVMGTVLSVTIEGLDQPAARRLIDIALTTAKHWDDVLTTWRASGELQRLNANAGNGPQPVSRDLYRTLRTMQALSFATGGAFDPAVGPLVAALRRNLPQRPHPSPQLRIATALRLVNGQAELVAGAALDAGGIGKGVAIDAMTALLQAHGVSSAYVDFGGSSIVAMGSRTSSTPWTVALVGRRPGEILGTVVLRDAALSTSRSVPSDDPAGAIIDPSRGETISPGRMATAIAPAAATAEAWSTALVVLGRAGLDRAAAHGIQALVTDTTGTWTTRGWRVAPYGDNSGAVPLQPHPERNSKETFGPMFLEQPN